MLSRLPGSGTDFDDRYVAKLKEQSIHPEIIKDAAKDMKIVYTPLHGTGNLPVRRVLKELGFTNVYVVPEQELPDGDFPTVSYPNPEAEEAFELGLKLAKEVDADLVLATDPDADRLGVHVKDKDGVYHTLLLHIHAQSQALLRRVLPGYCRYRAAVCKRS